MLEGGGSLRPEPCPAPQPPASVFFSVLAKAAPGRRRLAGGPLALLLLPGTLCCRLSSALGFQAKVYRSKGLHSYDEVGELTGWAFPAHTRGQGGPGPAGAQASWGYQRIP